MGRVFNDSTGWLGRTGEVIAGMSLLVASAQAGVVIDRFNTYQSLTALAGATVGGSVAAPEALGGVRGLEVTSSGPGEATVAIGGQYGDELASSLGWRTTGAATLTYDVLGGVNLLRGSPGFSLGVVTENQSESPGVDLILTVASLDGAIGTETRTVLPGFNGVVEFAFASAGFSSLDFSEVQSIALTIQNTSSPGFDMGLTYFVVVPELGTWFGGFALLGLGLLGLRRGKRSLKAAASRSWLGDR